MTPDEMVEIRQFTRRIANESFLYGQIACLLALRESSIGLTDVNVMRDGIDRLLAEYHTKLASIRKEEPE